MQGAVLSRIRSLLRTRGASYGFEYALLSSAIASLLVLTASLYASEIVRLIHELRCELSPNCTVQLEPVATDSAAPQTVALPVSQEQKQP